MQLKSLYGFVNLQDLFNRRVTEVGVEVVNQAIDATVAEHNRQINALMSLFAERTTQFKVKYNTPTIARLQPLDDRGRARPIKPFGQYEVAFPLQTGGRPGGRTIAPKSK